MANDIQFFSIDKDSIAAQGVYVPAALKALAWNPDEELLPRVRQWNQEKTVEKTVYDYYAYAEYADLAKTSYWQMQTIVQKILKKEKPLTYIFIDKKESKEKYSGALSDQIYNFLSDKYPYQAGLFEILKLYAKQDNSVEIDAGHEEEFKMYVQTNPKALEDYFLLKMREEFKSYRYQLNEENPAVKIIEESLAYLDFVEQHQKEIEEILTQDIESANIIQFSQRQIMLGLCVMMFLLLVLYNPTFDARGADGRLYRYSLRPISGNSGSFDGIIS